MPSHRTRRFGLCLAILISGCAAQPQSKDLLDIAVPTKEEIARQNAADVEAAGQVEEYKQWVCSQPEEKQRELIDNLAADQGWRIACSRTPAPAQQ